MAITSLKNLFQLQKTETGYVMDISSPCEAGGTLPIYIPRIMPKIDNGKPTTYTRTGPVLSFFIKPDIAYYGGDNDAAAIRCN